MRVRSVGALVAVMAAILIPAATAPAAPSPEPSAPPSVSVWPHTNLIDDQPMLIRLRNWQPSTYLVAWQCIAGAPAWGDNCDYVTRLTPGPQGGLRVRRPADVIVDRRHGGPVDCRVTACELLVRDANGPHVPNNSVVRVALTFDPAGPDPVRPTTTVTPNDDLRHGDEVRVTGDAFPIRAFAPTEVRPRPQPGGATEGDDGPPRPVYLYQCRADPESYRDCDDRTTQAPMTTAGDFTRRFTVRSRLFTDTGASIDCLAEPCVVAVSSNGEFSEAGIVALDFDPTGPVTPPPTVTVTPNTDLVDGQVVEITGQHFQPDSGISLALCPPDVTGYYFTACHDVPFLFAGTDGTGSVTFEHAVHATFETSRGPVDCRVLSCSFAVFSSVYIDDAPRAAIQVDPETALVDQQLVATPSTDLTGGQLITVSGEGYYPTDFTRVAQCALRRGHPDSPMCASIDRLVHPGGEFTSFTTTDFRVRRTPFTDFGRVDCTRRYCFVASFDQENRYVRGSRLRFRP